ncbi:MAG: cytochrome c oxidase subunit 3 [Bacteroidetes bacterium]|nr:cytochrome c oxidase subunit 3 [Bacteroidota bacterium]
MEINTTTKRALQPNTQPQIMENQRIILWLFMVASILSFGGLTSAYIVRMAQGNWMKFDLPNVFSINCLVVLASSACMVYAYRSAKTDEITQVKYGLWGAIIGGVVFLILQWLGWKELNAGDIYFSPRRSDNGDLTPLISGSFFFAISAIHFIHVIAGLIFLTIALVKTYQWQVHKKNLLTISLASTFWHFVGILWIYLYLFLKYWN